MHAKTVMYTFNQGLQLKIPPQVFVFSYTISDSFCKNANQFNTVYNKLIQLHNSFVLPCRKIV